MTPTRKTIKVIRRASNDFPVLFLALKRAIRAGRRIILAKIEFPTPPPFSKDPCDCNQGQVDQNLA